MCGIFAYCGNQTNAADIVFDGLKQLEYRGYDSWGVAVVPTVQSSKFRIQNEQILVKKQVGKIGNSNVDELPTSSLAIGHTRWATHGGVVQKNAHPHLDCSGKIAVIHNGIVENYVELKKPLLKRGHRFVSDTDTEVITHMIEEKIKHSDLPTAVRTVFNKLTGLSAIIVIAEGFDGFVAVRNGSPLVVGYGNDEMFLASDAAALLKHTKRVVFLEDNQMVIVKTKSATVADVVSGTTIVVKPQMLVWNASDANLGSYPFFMLKEIHEQPAIIKAIADDVLSQSKQLAKAIKDSYGTYLVGCGTAAYACLSGEYLFSEIAKRHINWAVASEFGYHQDFLTNRSLVVALSQSGETMDTLEAVKKAKMKGAKLATLVNVMGSTLFRVSDIKLMIGAGPEKSVASTKAFIGMLTNLILVAYTLDGRHDEGQKVLRQASRSVKKVLSEVSVKQIVKIARSIKNCEHAFFVGRGLSYPASLEAALKLKEISYIHAEGFAAGELKHGVLALVEKGTPCFVYAPDDQMHGANLAGAMEMKARGGRIIGISDKPHEVFDDYIEVPDAGFATIIPNIVTAQLLAYYVTIEKELDPDKPRNLAKSVTVK